MEVILNLTGFKELISTLEELGPAVETKAVRFAVREAAKPILRDARINAPVGKYPESSGRVGGLLKKSIKIRAFKRRRKGVVGVTVGASSRDLPEGKVFYGYFQERGWVTGKRTAEEKRSQAKGIERQPREGQRKIPGKFFVRRAFDANKNMSANVMADLIKQGIAREAERLARKKGKA